MSKSKITVSLIKDSRRRDLKASDIADKHEVSISTLEKIRASKLNTILEVLLTEIDRLENEIEETRRNLIANKLPSIKDTVYCYRKNNIITMSFDTIAIIINLASSKARIEDNFKLEGKSIDFEEFKELINKHIK